MNRDNRVSGLGSEEPEISQYLIHILSFVAYLHCSCYPVSANMSQQSACRPLLIIRSETGMATHSML
jgi:hypothetical protein